MADRTMPTPAIAATPKANQRFAQLHREISDYHSSPVDAARIAEVERELQRLGRKDVGSR